MPVIAYLAGSVPSHVRKSKLSHLPVQAFIGSWMIESTTDFGQRFDVMMLPEMEFRRAEHLLRQGNFSTPELSRGRMQIAYSISDMKRIDVPADCRDPRSYAAAALARLFDLDIDRTVYADGPSVAAAMRIRQTTDLLPSAPVIESPFIAAIAARVLLEALPATQPLTSATPLARKRQKIIFKDTAA